MRASLENEGSEGRGNRWECQRQQSQTLNPGLYTLGALFLPSLDKVQGFDWGTNSQRCHTYLNPSNPRWGGIKLQPTEGNITTCCQSQHETENMRTFIEVLLRLWTNKSHKLLLDPWGCTLQTGVLKTSWQLYQYILPSPNGRCSGLTTGPEYTKSSQKVGKGISELRNWII